MPMYRTRHPLVNTIVSPSFTHFTVYHGCADEYPAANRKNKADKAKRRQLWNDECRLSIVELRYSIIFLIIKIKSQLFGILNFGHCDLPFDLAQGGGEFVEPFGICDLLFVI